MGEQPAVDQTAMPTTPTVAWPMFLAEYPPGQLAIIDKIGSSFYSLATGGMRGTLNTPVVVLRCDSPSCGGARYFDCRSRDLEVGMNEWEQRFLKYQCRHCEETEKLFAVSCMATDGVDGKGAAIKIGEIPPFGPHIPPRVLRLIQPDYEFFKKGRRAESQGLGIGAFAYYRRVVENQKDRLFDKLISVAQTVGISDLRCKALEEAKSGFQFRSAVAEFKDLIPDSLLIKGHNPLTLLHTALSRGLHNESDDECLDLARDIRAILTMFAEKLAQALSDDAEMNQAISHLTGGGQTDISAGDDASGDRGAGDNG